MTKVWKWIITAVSMVVALALAYFVSSKRSATDTKAAVDATRADDAVKEAQTQDSAIVKRSQELAAIALANDTKIDAERAALTTGKVDYNAIDQLLRDRGILR